MKLRRQASKRKWGNRFYRLEKAASFQAVSLDLPMSDIWARATVNTALDVWLSMHSIGEVGERQIDVSDEGVIEGSSLWNTRSVLYRCSVMAKRPYWAKARP